MPCTRSNKRGTQCCSTYWKLVNASRAYCDRCIASGEILAQKRGLDPGTYCQQMKVSYKDLMDANPGIFGTLQQQLPDELSPKDQKVDEIIISRCVGKMRA